MAEARKRGRPRTDPRLDTWHGVADARERKRIQDRLAQRTRRTRVLARSSKDRVNPPTHKADRTSSSTIQRTAEALGFSNSNLEESAYEEPDLHSTPLRPSLENSSSSSPGSSESSNTQRTSTWQAPSCNVYSDQHFISSPSWAIYSALGKHGLMQGTPFCGGDIEEMRSPARYMSLPEGLRPSPLQLALPHTHWIDRFPFPRLRDNMIILKHVIDLEEFVRDLFGTTSLVLRDGSQRPTWDPQAWTIGSDFSQKWGYLFM